ncbi:MAG: hypothetical protein IJE29_05975 [Firmicutes bacterium]|nr:hypothetical protein [Bacillota bacterium]MBQ3200047.1 hypothetical protein [Bacillota bacterium]
MSDQPTHKYDDIINLPCPTSARHPRMALYDRAAQFSPFAALTGHEAAMQETARLTAAPPELNEDTLADLDSKLQLLQHLLQSAGQTDTAITYFQPDEHKEGGCYLHHSGRIKKIDQYRRLLIFADGAAIKINSITEIHIGQQE